MGTDCTNNGITSGNARAVLLLETPSINFVSTFDIPCLKLIPGRGNRKYIAVPADTPDREYPMFGGHFIYTSDSSFPSDQPIHVHDRFELNNII